jgi:hypothetical protein
VKLRGNKLFKKMIEAAKEPRKPLTKAALLKFFKWQIIWLGTAFFFAILDLTDAMHLRVHAILTFIFLPFWLTLVAYRDISEAGLEGEPASLVALSQGHASGKTHFRTNGHRWRINKFLNNTDALPLDAMFMARGWLCSEYVANHEDEDHPGSVYYLSDVGLVFLDSSE